MEHHHHHQQQQVATKSVGNLTHFLLAIVEDAITRCDMIQRYDTTKRYQKPIPSDAIHCQYSKYILSNKAASYTSTDFFTYEKKLHLQTSVDCKLSSSCH